MRGHRLSGIPTDPDFDGWNLTIKMWKDLEKDYQGLLEAAIKQRDEAIEILLDADESGTLGGSLLQRARNVIQKHTPDEVWIRASGGTK